MNKRSIVLPGQSRSITCSKRACRRLDGHKGACRQSLTSSAPTASKATVRPSAVVTEGGVEVRSSDVYTVLDAPAPAKARKARRPKVVVIPMAEYTRLVAAAQKHTRRSRYITSGQPSARLA